MGDVPELIKAIISPGSDADTVRRLISSSSADVPEILSAVRVQKAEMRARGVPGNTAEHVFEGDYLEAIPSIIEDDRVYKALSDAEVVLDADSHDDVDLRSVTQIYLELVDIVAVDLKEACERCRRYPEKRDLEIAENCLSLIESLLTAGANQLSLRSTESPATFRTKGLKAVANCRSHVERVTHGTGMDVPALTGHLNHLCNTFWSLCEDESLASLQNQRNENWREDHKWIHDWLTRKVMEMNGEVEDLDLTDLTQRRYLAQLISLSQDVLNDYNADH